MKLTLLEDDRKTEYKKILQEAFQYGFESYTGREEEQVLPESHIDECLSNPNSYAYMMIDNHGIVGGSIVTINNETNENILDFMFVKVGVQSKGIGQQIWKKLKHYIQTLHYGKHVHPILM